MPFLNYDYKRELTKSEKLIQGKSYPYVCTITRNPYEVLKPHAHHSSNIRYIVEGEMTVWNSKDGKKLAMFGPGDSVLVTAQSCYRAEMGAQGCTFVEGHKDLSPSSAKRFVESGTMTEMTERPMKDNGKDALDCSRGRCHQSQDGRYHMCVEHDAKSPNQVCDLKK